MWPNEVLKKRYSGEASFEKKSLHDQKSNYVEGNSKMVDYKGKTKRIIKDIEDGLRSSFSYVGAENIEQFKQSVDFTCVSQSSIVEAHPFLLKE